jgi:hypothetical protein
MESTKLIACARHTPELCGRFLITAEGAVTSCADNSSR